jgi:hypothetical protein
MRKGEREERFLLTGEGEVSCVFFTYSDCSRML